MGNRPAVARRFASVAGDSGDLRDKGEEAGELESRRGGVGGETSNEGFGRRTGPSGVANSCVVSMPSGECTSSRSRLTGVVLVRPPVVIGGGDCGPSATVSVERRGRGRKKLTVDEGHAGESDRRVRGAGASARHRRAHALRHQRRHIEEEEGRDCEFLDAFRTRSGQKKRDRFSSSCGAKRTRVERERGRGTESTSSPMRLPNVNRSSRALKELAKYLPN